MISSRTVRPSSFTVAAADLRRPRISSCSPPQARHHKGVRMKVHLTHRPHGRYRSFVCLAVLAAVVCFAGTAAARSTKAGALPTLKVGATYSYDQFWTNPGQYAAAGREGNFVEGFTFAPILHMKPSGSLAPALATS